MGQGSLIPLSIPFWWNVNKRGRSSMLQSMVQILKTERHSSQRLTGVIYMQPKAV